MLHILHLVGSYPLLFGFVAQVVVVSASQKDKDKKVRVQALILMGALGLVRVSIALRPKSPPDLIPDIMASVGALFLLTPAVTELIKLRQKVKESGG